MSFDPLPNSKVGLLHDTHLLIVYFSAPKSERQFTNIILFFFIPNDLDVETAIISYKFKFSHMVLRIIFVPFSQKAYFDSLLENKEEDFENTYILVSFLCRWEHQILWFTSRSEISRGKQCYLRQGWNQIQRFVDLLIWLG